MCAGSTKDIGGPRVENPWSIATGDHVTQDKEAILSLLKVHFHAENVLSLE
jgi:hypothetical protein